jgi:hypothetical protein
MFRIKKIIEIIEYKAGIYIGCQKNCSTPTRPRTIFVQIFCCQDGGQFRDDTCLPEAASGFSVITSYRFMF